MNRRLIFSCAVLVAAVACGHAGPGDQAESRAPSAAEEPPVALNPDIPVAYPPALYDRGVDGEVVLRLFVDSAGRLAPESTRVAESSGYPAMDSAALRGSPRLHYAPAKRHGLAVAAVFLQPIQFRHPTGATIAPASGAPVVAAPVTAQVPATKHRRRASRPKPDTLPARGDSTLVRPDSTPAAPHDTSVVPHDTTADSSHVKKDSSASSH